MSSFTLLEVIIVIALLSLLATVSSGYYRNYVRYVELDSQTKQILADLKHARAKAMTGENNLKWGIHFMNGANDYYELFSTPTTYTDPSKVIDTTIYLPGNVIFTTPSEGNTIDVIFNKITGNTTATSVILSSEGNAKTITVSAIGNIY